VGSNIQKVADLDARDDQAAALARRQTAWLALGFAACQVQ